MRSAGRRLAIAGATVSLSLVGCGDVDLSGIAARAEVYRDDSGRLLVVLDECRLVTQIAVLEDSTEGGIVWGAQASTAHELDRFVIGEAPDGFVETWELKPFVEEAHSVVALGPMSEQGTTAAIATFRSDDVPAADEAEVAECEAAP